METERGKEARTMRTTLEETEKRETNKGRGRVISEIERKIGTEKGTETGMKTERRKRVKSMMTN